MKSLQIMKNLRIMKSKVRPSSKRYFVTIKINESNRWTFLKEYLWTSNDIIKNFYEKNGIRHENSHIS